MGIIRDGNMKVKKISPLSIRDIFDSSQNRPFLIQGVDSETGDIGYYVLKPTVGLRMYSGAALKELLSSFIAIELEIPIPEPVVIIITREFAELYRDESYYQILSDSIGSNFGTLYLDSGYSTWMEAHYHNKLLFQAIQKTFVFDTFIDNADRNNFRPNMLVGHDEIYLIDHELAFSFTNAILYNNPTPWMLNENDCTLAQQHLFYYFLKGKQFISDNLIQKMSNIDEQFLDNFEQHLPHLWRNEVFDKIKNFILLRTANLGEFRNEIERLLL